MRFRDCTCPDCTGRADGTPAQHAHLSVRCAETGDLIDLRVPWAARHDSVAWGDSDRITWRPTDSPDELVGVEIARGLRGVTVVDGTGQYHRLDNGRFSRRAFKPAALTAMGKAAAAKPRTGQRWITVHPHGADEKGVPVLIEQNHDKSWRVVGGAGGKLTHLRLTNVKSEEEYAAAAKEKRAEKADKEKERVAAQSDEEREKEKASKAELKGKKQLAERDFIHKVRGKVGGVDDDIAPDRLHGLSEGAKNLILTRHHARQLRQATERLNAMQAEVVGERVSAERERALIDAYADEAPELAEVARAMATETLELDAMEADEVQAERRARKARQPSVRPGESAADKIAEVIKAADDPSNKLSRLGGRDDDPSSGPLRQSLLPSEEVERRSLQALDDAKALLDAAEAAAEGKVPASPIVDAAMERLGLEEKDPAAVAAALKSEAARKFRRSEVLDKRADTLRSIENEEGGATKAANSLAYSDLLSGIAQSASTAKKMGLTDTERVPLSDGHVAEFIDLMKEREKLRAAHREFDAMQKALEGGEYDRSRRAFDLSPAQLDAKVAESIEEQIQRELTNRLLGVSDQRSADHLQAVANGHYGGLADVALGIAGQRYLDRPTVDAIGLRNASILMRAALEEDGHDRGDVLASLEDVHVDRLKTLQADALAKVDAIVPGLTTTVETAGDLEAAMAQLDVHEADAADAQRAVGAALGTLEATATLSQAFRDPIPSAITVRAGDTGLDGTLQWLHAVGLKPDDYHLDYKNKLIDVPRAAWSKLIQREPPELRKQRETVDAIKRGEHDEAGWLPEGLTRRNRDAYTDPAPEVPYFHEPIPGHLTGPELRAAMRDHVGARLAMGEHPVDVQRDLRSPVAMDAVRDVADYSAAIVELFPMKDAEGNVAKAEAFKPHYDAIAADYMQRRQPGVEPFQSQSIGPDTPEVQEATYRALLAQPDARWAFAPHGELPPEGRRAIREAFYKKMGMESPTKRNYEGAFEKAMADVGQEPPKDADTGTLGMFGAPAPGAVSAEWQKWRENAMKVAARYPAEGAALWRRLHGPRPERERPAALSPAAAQAALEMHAREPWSSPQRIADSVRDALGLTRAEVSGADVGRYLAPEVWDRARRRFDARARAGSPWGQYVFTMGGVEPAIAAMQHELRGAFVAKFHEHHAQLTGKPLQRGIAEVPNREQHVMATASEEEREKIRKLRAETMETLRERDDSGRYSDMGGEGALIEEYRRDTRTTAAYGEGQGGLFGGGGVVADDEGPGLFGAPAKPAPPPKRPAPRALQAGERWSLGDRAEEEIGAMIRRVGAQVRPGMNPIKLFTLNMDGPRVDQQRAVKTLLANGGRLGGWLGTGSGKTAIAIGSTTALIERGQAPHGLHLVPVAVQSQFDDEMLRFTEPGKYRWQTGDKLSHAQRVAMLANPDLHMRVLTHQSFRDSAVKIMAEHHGRTEEQMAADLRKADQGTAAKWMRDAFDANGIKPGFVYLDEAHMATARDEEGSLLSAVMNAATHPLNATHMLRGTATPHKNDESEVYSMAASLDPGRYGDRAKFMADFGADLQHNPEAIRRELAHLTYSAKIDPRGVERLVSDNPRVGSDGRKVTEPVTLTGEHKARVDRVRELYQRARAARERGTVDVEALRELTPGAFVGRPESEHEQIARDRTESLGMVRDHALRRAVNQAPPEHNVKLQRLAEVIEHDLKHGTWKDSKTGAVSTGKPSIVFSDSKREVHMIAEHLKARGIRAVAYTGELNHAQRDDARHGFNPESGDARYDVLVATSAAEAGVNLQRAKVLHHYDVPQTAKSWAQRTGRAYRQGQRGDVEVHNWSTDDEFEQAALRRLRRKEGLANVFETPLGAMDERGIAGVYRRHLAIKHQHRDTETELRRAS